MKLNKRRKQKAWRKTQINRIRSIDMSICFNCGEKGPHYVPPGMGIPGFYMCKPQENPGPKFR